MSCSGCRYVHHIVSWCHIVCMLRDVETRNIEKQSRFLFDGRTCFDRRSAKYCRQMRSIHRSSPSPVSRHASFPNVCANSLHGELPSTFNSPSNPSPCNSASSSTLKTRPSSRTTTLYRLGLSSLLPVITPTLLLPPPAVPGIPSSLLLPPPGEDISPGVPTVRTTLTNIRRNCRTASCGG